MLYFWETGHEHIFGNDKADQVAMDGAGLQFCGPAPLLSVSTCIAKNNMNPVLNIRLALSNKFFINQLFYEHAQYGSGDLLK